MHAGVWTRTRFFFAFFLFLKTIHCYFHSTIHTNTLLIGHMRVSVSARAFCLKHYGQYNANHMHAFVNAYCYMLNMCIKYIIIWQYDNITVVHCTANGNDDDGDATTDKLKNTLKTWEKNTPTHTHQNKDILHYIPHIVVCWNYCKTTETKS